MCGCLFLSARSDRGLNLPFTTSWRLFVSSVDLMNVFGGIFARSVVDEEHCHIATRSDVGLLISGVVEIAGYIIW